MTKETSYERTVGRGWDPSGQDGVIRVIAAYTAIDQLTAALRLVEHVMDTCEKACVACYWHAPGLYLAMNKGEVTHRPDGRRVRPDSPPKRAILTGPDAAACAAFNRLCRSFASDRDPRKLIPGWMRAVSQNSVVEPWQNLLVRIPSDASH